MARSLLFPAQLYGIVDLGYTQPADLERVTREMIAGGIDIIQLRAKGYSDSDIERWARKLLPICHGGGVPFIVNDSPKIAASIGADGVHVGQDDPSMDEVRYIVGDDMLVGRSTHSVEQAAAAAADPRTDCIGFGPLFATPTKPTYTPIGIKEISQVHESHPDLPIFCIGGIKKENLNQVMNAGAKRAVIVSGILQASDIAAYVRESKALLADTL
ncbi:MAG: thiamine phosphate synthase [Verrucomicrobiales bacterium]|nr:thiamine phosphate synthase [Verrucomicrobiales bacterium]|tara:strand:- start:4274 stop:4918 length:645 start_codon:yes stop_codon:yes gene_type:complete